jgi:effector-binding domain-containing protein
MRVAVISLILACIAGLAAFFIIEKVETPTKQTEANQSGIALPDPKKSEGPDTQAATGLQPVVPPQTLQVPQPEEPKTQPPVASTAPTETSPQSQSQLAPASSLQGLAPPPADPSTPDDVVMTSHAALVLRGQARWDDGYGALGKAFSQLRDQAKQLNLNEIGYPVTVFIETDDQGFKYEAELPVASLPAQRPAGLPADMRLGATPEGKAIRFVHRGAYDEIDSTYEAISAYVDVKGVEVKDTLIEEYVEIGNDSSDMAIEVHIYVQPVK